MRTAVPWSTPPAWLLNITTAQAPRQLLVRTDTEGQQWPPAIGVDQHAALDAYSDSRTNEMVPFVTSANFIRLAHSDIVVMPCPPPVSVSP